MLRYNLGIRFQTKSCDFEIPQFIVPMRKFLFVFFCCLSFSINKLRTVCLFCKLLYIYIFLKSDYTISDFFQQIVLLLLTEYFMKRITLIIRNFKLQKNFRSSSIFEFRIRERSKKMILVVK